VVSQDELGAKVYAAVAGIPAGYVLSYGALAGMAGAPRNPRLVGQLMSRAPRELPSHRVVNHAGRTVPGWIEQRALLEAEGVIFKENGCVDLRYSLWRPD